RVQQRVIAKTGELDAQLLRRSDHEGAARHGYLLAVDRQRDVAQDATSAATPGPTPVNGQRPSRTCASYSSLKYLSEEAIGETAPSARAQNALKRMLSPMFERSGISSSRPYPDSMRSRTRVAHHVPSRQGVHLPQDS